MRGNSERTIKVRMGERYWNVGFVLVWKWIHDAIQLICQFFVDLRWCFD